MPFVAPWLRPVDTLGAIQAGSHAGLQLRSQDQQAEAQAIAQQLAQQRALASEQEAADRLRYHYDALAATQEQRRRAEALKREEDAASRTLRKSDADSLQAYRMKRLENDALGLAERKSMRPEVRILPTGEMVQINPDASFKTVRPPTVPSEKPLSAAERLRARIQANAMKVPRASEDPGSPEYQQRVDAADAILKELEGDQVGEKVAKVSKTLDKNLAKQFLLQAKGDKEKARQLAKDAGYSF